MYIKKEGKGLGAALGPGLPRSLSPPLVLALVVGAYLGGYLHAARDSRGLVQRPSPGRTREAAVAGIVGHVDQVPPQPANHKPDSLGRPLMKQVMVSNGHVPHLTGFTRAVLKPGQVVEAHSHASMHEVFYVEEGDGSFVLGEGPAAVTVPVRRGSYVHLPPNQVHSVLNPDSPTDGGQQQQQGHGDLVLLFFGVAVEGGR